MINSFHIKRTVRLGNRSGIWSFIVPIKKVVGPLAIHRPAFTPEPSQLRQFDFGIPIAARISNKGWRVSHIDSGSGVMGDIDGFSTIDLAERFANALIEGCPSIVTAESSFDINDEDMEKAQSIIERFKL